MPQLTGTVAYVNQPKPGKKMGSVKVNDTYIGVWPNQLGDFRQGENVTLEYEEMEGGFKKLSRLVQQVVPAAASVAASPAGGSPGSACTPEDMFVMGVIGRSLQGTGMVPDDESLQGWVKRLRKAWKSGTADELNDDVPF